MMAMSLFKSVYATLIVGFLVAPLLVVLPLAFTSGAFLTYPIPSYSFRWFSELVENTVWSRAILNSLLIAGSTTVVATLLGTLAALGLRARNLVLSSQIRTLFLLPMVVPAVVLGVGMQALFVRFADSQMGHNQPMLRPKESDRLDWEGELVVVIGKSGAIGGAEFADDRRSAQ